MKTQRCGSDAGVGEEDRSYTKWDGGFVLPSPPLREPPEPHRRSVYDFKMPLLLLFITCVAFVRASYTRSFPRSTSPNCISFARSFPLSEYNASLINATCHAQGTWNLAGSSNNVSFCEIFASVQYGTNDTLNFALWLPDNSTYEGRFMAVGNGAMAGTIDFANMLVQLNNGFGMAVAGSDAGHRASANNGGIGASGVYLPYLHDKTQTRAWIHNAVSVFTPLGRRMMKAYYGKRPSYTYFDGCSTGGAQGFSLAQFHPGLFDGIYAGSPGNWYSHLALSFLWNAQHTNTTSTNLPLATLIAMRNAIIGSCDTLDGVKDGVIENPLKCHFNVNSLACNSTVANSSCLTADQLQAAKSIYAGPIRSDNGSQLYPGFSFGSEVGWSLQEGPLANIFTIPLLQNAVFNNLKYDANTFNWASDISLLRKRLGNLIDAISPDLCAFRAKGGKLISTQGWADPLNAATWPIEQLGQIQNFMGGDVSDFYNLFMVPGGGHCGSQPSYPNVPGTYHRVPALVKWVEEGIKPTELLSSGPPAGNGTRKLCPWPATAKYTGGDSNSWASYKCV